MTMIEHKEDSPNPEAIVEHVGVRIDRLQQTASLEGRKLELTGTAFRLLEFLLRAPGQTFTRAQLSTTVIGGGAIVLERTIDVHVAALRRKLGRPGLIETVRRVGYRFRTRQ